ncbi:hypothetical protein WSM22_36500 [Cytophagales bacterium WSM2-2]|nr:hypothetical protein WSM22_36500 [Cytophagales bacterium WSM2-2]
MKIRISYGILVYGLFILILSSCKKDDPAPLPLAVTSFSPSQGAVGSTVVITGVSFSSTLANNVVKFNSIAAVVTAATPTELTVTVPAGATDGKISVTVNNVISESADNFKIIDYWTPMADFGGAARTFIGFSMSINGKGYVGCGTTPAGQNLVDFWEYNPTTNAWTQKADFKGAARFFASAFGIGSKGYVGCGAGTGSPQPLYSDFWEYDPANNNWSQKSNFGGAGRTTAASFVIGTKGYIGTGRANGGAVKDFWEYDQPTDTWTKKADFPDVARQFALGFAIGSNGYIAGGFTDLSASLYTIYEYNPSLNQWNQKTSMSNQVSMDYPTAFASSSKGYVGGPLKQLWQFDPVANTWSRKADLPGEVRIGMAFTIGTNGYMGLGYNIVNQTVVPHQSFYRYTAE